MSKQIKINYKDEDITKLNLSAQDESDIRAFVRTFPIPTKENYKEPFTMIQKAKATHDGMQKLIAAQWLVYLASQHPAYIAPLFYRDDYGHAMIPRPFHYEWLDYIVKNDIDMLLILAARGHAKSIYISQVAPVFILGKNPSLRVQLQAVNDDLAKRFTRQLIRVLTSPLFHSVFPDCPTVKKKNEHMIYLTEDERDPSFMAQGWESGVTGYRADVILYEDLVTREIAQSETQRKKQIEWHKETMRPVLTPGGRILATGTPYHEEDAWNYCEKEGGFNVIRYPACNDNFENILWPERFTIDVLHQIAEEVGSSAFTTQYLCKSSSSSGEVFQKEWFAITNELPKNNDSYDIGDMWWTWDTAISQKTSADFTCGVLGGVSRDGKAIILDVVHGKFTPAQTKKEIVKAYRNSVKMFGDKVQGVLIEETKESHVWKAWIEEDKETRDIAVILCPHEGIDKYSRAARIVPKCESRSVLLYKGEWNDKLLSELSKFTADGRHAHDDLVDAFSYLLSRLYKIYNKKANNSQFLPGAFGRGNGGNGGQRLQFIS